ncbi:hypothetical protein H072_6259 [Dactylellina haptotyla CBS 200.50]|uniref:Uncharacterized protein n=1 Tax=Dactylellina haptotyla (strain CBS 200.50) TaxID=1284197 RepID=S8BKD3_DACHA|nr:hypothetical protein H072_6259 [Dactylellina haptotyla CBS 200.50]
MLLQVEKGKVRGVEEGSYIQQRQHRRKCPTTTSSGPLLHPRQEATPVPLFPDPVNGGGILIVPGSTVTESTTTYTNPGYMILQQWTTIVVSGTTTVKSQITYAELGPSGIPQRPNGSPNNNDSNFTGLITDSAPTISPTLLPTMSSRTPTPRPTSGGLSKNNEESGQTFSPTLIFIVVLVIVLGALLSTVSIILYRRSKRRKRERHGMDRENHSPEKDSIVRPYAPTPSSRRTDSPLPLPPPISPVTDRPVSASTRKQSALLPSPMTEFQSYPNFPAPPVVPHRNPRWTLVLPTPPLPAASGPSDTSKPSVASSSNRTARSRVDTNASTVTLETHRVIHQTSPATLSPISRHKSFVSMESAIDPDLSFGVNGSRLSTQFGDGTDDPPEGFTYWADYDFSKKPSNSRKSIHDSPSMMSPRLSPLGENSMWEEALMDVNLEGVSPTDSGGSVKA